MTFNGIKKDFNDWSNDYLIKKLNLKNDLELGTLVLEEKFNSSKTEKIKSQIYKKWEIIYNQISKIFNYTNRAVAGPNKCLSTIQNQFNNIKNLYQKFLQIIVQNYDLRLILLELIENEIKSEINLQTIKLNCLTDEITKSVKEKAILKDNHQDTNNFYDISMNTYINNEFYIYKANTNFWKRLFTFSKIAKSIKLDYKNTKKATKNLKKKSVNLKIAIENMNEVINQQDYDINILIAKIDSLKKDDIHLDTFRVEDFEQYVYVVSTNTYQDSNFYKIGKTNNIKKRLSSLSTSSPDEFIIIQLYKCNNNTEIEKFLHQYFDEKRVNKNREFFKLSLNDLFSIEKLLASNYQNTIRIHENTLY